MRKTAILMISLLMQIMSVAQKGGEGILSSEKSRSSNGKKFLKKFNKQQRVSDSGMVVYGNDTLPLILKQANVLYQNGKYSNALRKYTEALGRAERNNKQDMASAAYEGLGKTYSAIHQLSASIPVFKEALRINQKLGSADGIMRVTNYLSNDYYNKGNFDSASIFAGISMKYAASLKMIDKLQTARLAYIASAIRLKKFVDADKEIKRLSEGSIDNQNPNIPVQYYSLMGNYYVAKNQPEKSRLYYDSAFQLAKAQVSPALLTYIYAQMIDSYYEKDDYKKCVDYLQQYKESIRNMYLQSSKVKVSGPVAILPNDLYKNEIHIQNIEKKLKDLRLLQEAAKSQLKDIRLHEGEVVRLALQRDNILKDSLIRLNELLFQKEKSLLELMAKGYKNEIAQRRKETEHRELLNKNLVIAEQKKLIMEIGLGVFILLGSIIFIQYIKQRKKNVIIQRQKEELQTLMKEIHHRVKNNLQVICSLLDLQSQTVGDSRASEAIKEGKNRVLSMALIHQNLYGEDNIKGLNVKEYILNLAQRLIDSYHLDPAGITIITDIEDLSLDVETVIPLGLILNELISNALKYAFKKEQHGEIQILLKEQDDLLILKVKDNGQGFSPDANVTQSTSFGIKLIKAFALKLKAKLEMYNEDGACITMQIRKYKRA